MAVRTTKKKTSKASSTKKASPVKIQKTTFKYFAPEAKEICIAGSFNQWMDKDLYLKKDKTGHWKVALPLGKGRYEYRYIVDGNWTNAQDQLECVPNSYGTWNSVIQIQA